MKIIKINFKYKLINNISKINETKFNYQIFCR